MLQAGVIHSAAVTTNLHMQMPIKRHSAALTTQECQ